MDLKMKLKEKIIRWCGGFTQQEVDTELSKMVASIFTIINERFVPLTYTAKKVIDVSTTDIYNLDYAINDAKIDLKKQIVDEIFKTTNLFSYSQDEIFERYGGSIIITAKTTIFVKEN